MRAASIVLALALGVVAGATATWFAVRRPAAPTDAPSGAGKEALYWYDPMVPDQHFDKPGKSPFMDMQLVPKYAGGASTGPGVVQIDPREVQNLGVRTAKAERGRSTTSVRATGTVAVDERAVSVVQSRVPGIVERLEVRAPLAAVRRGQALLTILAPDWTAAQEEYLSLRRAKTEGLEPLRAAARQRLVLLGMSESEIRAVEHAGSAQTRVTLTAPRDGIVSELDVRDGATVMAGAPLMRISGLDTVWINAAIPEAQAGRVSTDSTVEVDVSSFPGERFGGRVEALLANVDAATRTQTARIVVANADHRLVPGMFARVEVSGAKDATKHILVPTEAVIATGTRNVVIVEDDEGRFRAQEVRIGDEAGGKTQILDGVEDDETVVLSGQFLIDSEASLSGTLARLGGAEQSEASTQETSESGEGARTSEQKLHLAEGNVSRIEGDRWTIATDAIPSLEMGAMTMTFVCPRNKPAEDIRVGQRVSFGFFRNADGEFEIDKIAVIEPAKAKPKPAGAKP